jgi:superfamily I DNA/RNA helicase/mRNA-degrading endonuclease RelE of RelBE toxin-antitoxin system
MHKWSVSSSSTFLNELLDVPKQTGKKVPKKVEILEVDPYSAQGDAKKLKGYKTDVYRVRIGSYRIFYVIGGSWVKLLSIRKRDGAYDHDDLRDFFVPDSPPDDADLMPVPVESLAQLSVIDVHTASSRPLPSTLTESRLKQWHIPEEYWPDLLSVHDEDALLNLAVPAHILDRVVDNLFPNPSLEAIDAQPELVLRQPADLDRFVEGELTAFLLKLDPDQQHFYTFRGSGPTLVKGGPGTGKSTLALYRVQHLLDHGYTSILFTTYTNALVQYSEHLLEHLLGQPPARCGVTVSTVDKLSIQYYTRHCGKPTIDTTNEARRCLDEALETATIPARNRLDCLGRQEMLKHLGTTYILDEFQDVIDDWGIDTCEAYCAVARRGRGTPLVPAIREALWAVYQMWRDLLAQRGVVTWQQVRLGALKYAVTLANRPYQAVIIDEAQDLSPVALRLLLSLTESPQGVYLTADAMQSIYQRGFSWKQVHSDLNVRGRTLILRRNYRNTTQITNAYTTILRDVTDVDDETLYPYLSPHTGDVPSIILTDDERQEAVAIYEFFTQASRRFRLPVHGSAVLCPSNRIGKKIAYALSQMGMEAEYVSGKGIDVEQPCVKILTLQAAKGLEFPFVAIVGLKAGILPRGIDPAMPTDEADILLAKQRRLFFVGCSRAMRALLVCGSAAHPSPFLDTLTAPTWQRSP